jgi:hypothetical protein
LLSGHRFAQLSGIGEKMNKTICLCVGLGLIWSHGAQGGNKKNTTTYSPPRTVRSTGGYHPSAMRHYTAPQRNFRASTMHSNTRTFNNVRQNPNFQAQRNQNFHSQPRQNFRPQQSQNLHTQQNQNVQKSHGLNARTSPHTNFQRTQIDRKLTNFHSRDDRFSANRNFTSHERGLTHIRNSHEVFRSYHRYVHDRGWWRYHYNRIVLVGGGYYYWDGGYWFPAWGYDPGFVAYAYDGPIYSYNNLPPDQVIVTIQESLQDQGYYTGDVDGELGAKTRDAIAAYQRDHGLEVTAAVDEPTVQALGLS